MSKEIISVQGLCEIFFLYIKIYKHFDKKYWAYVMQLQWIWNFQ